MFSGSFHLMHLMFDDYVLYLVENLHSQERANDFMRIVKGDTKDGITFIVVFNCYCLFCFLFVCFFLFIFALLGVAGVFTLMQKLKPTNPNQLNVKTK